MNHLSDEDRRIIEEELLHEANYRRHERFWDSHWQLLSYFSPKTRNTILDIECIVLGIPVILVWGYIVIRLLFH